MLFSLWRRLRNRNPNPSRGKSLQANRHSSYRPRLEPLEDRVLPAVAAGGVFAPAVGPSVVSGFQQTGIKPPGVTRPMAVTVAENSPPTVIDLGPVFAAMSALHPGNGLKLSILGNTNSALVRTDLSKAALTLTYAPGRWGTATITVRATDADGVSVQQTLLVTVSPLGSTGPVSVSPASAGTPGSMTPGMPK
jgi:hypothetical protein